MAGEDSDNKAWGINVDYADMVRDPIWSTRTIS